MSKFRLRINIYCVIQRFSEAYNSWVTIRTIAAEPAKTKPTEIEDFDVTEIKNLLNVLVTKTKQEFLQQLKNSYRKRANVSAVRKITDFLECE